MKIAVIADIHSNIYALKASYDYIKKEKIKKIIVLGDLVSDCPYPNRVMKFLYKWAKEDELIFIKGNREEYLLEFDENAVLQPNMESIRYTYQNLDKVFLSKMKDYPYTYTTTIGTMELLFAHGVPDNTRELLYPNQENTIKYLDRSEANIIFCAHSHKAFVYEYKDKLLINPGCLGHFRDGNKSANFCTIDISHDKIDVQNIMCPYDTDQLIQDFSDSGLKSIGGPYIECLIYAFKTGIFFGSEMLELGKELGATREAYLEAYNILLKRYKDERRCNIL